MRFGKITYGSGPVSGCKFDGIFGMARVPFHGRIRTHGKSLDNIGEELVFAVYFDNQGREELTLGGVNRAHCTEVSVYTNMDVSCCFVDFVDHHFVQTRVHRRGYTTYIDVYTAGGAVQEITEKDLMINIEGGTVARGKPVEVHHHRATLRLLFGSTGGYLWRSLHHPVGVGPECVGLELLEYMVNTFASCFQVCAWW